MYKDLLVKLAALYGSCKNYHYSAKGFDFWGNHLFGDRLSEEILDYMDSIQEVCFLGRNLPAVCWGEIFSLAETQVAFGDNPLSIMQGIKDLVLSILNDISDCQEECTAGEQDLMGKIAFSMQQNLGFIQRYLG